MATAAEPLTASPAAVLPHPVNVVVVGTVREACRRVTRRLRAEGAEVVDLAECALSWWRVDHSHFEWGARQVRAGLDAPQVVGAFDTAMDALTECDVCVLVGPAPNGDALMMAGIAHGMGKRLVVLLGRPADKPLVMYRAAENACVSIGEVVDAVRDEAATRAASLVGRCLYCGGEGILAGPGGAPVGCSQCAWPGHLGPALEGVA